MALPAPTAPSQQLPSQLDCLDLASPQLLHPGGPCTALALPGTLDASPGDLPGQGQAGVNPLGLGPSLGLEFGLWPKEGPLSLGVGLEERLGLGVDPRIRRWNMN